MPGRALFGHLERGYHRKVRATITPDHPHEPETGAVKRPYVNIKITREGATIEQKAELIRGVTRLLQETLGKNPETTVVVIDEVELDNWGIGGMPVTQFRQGGG